MVKKGLEIGMERESYSFDTKGSENMPKEGHYLTTYEYKQKEMVLRGEKFQVPNLYNLHL